MKLLVVEDEALLRHHNRKHDSLDEQPLAQNA